MLRLACYVLLAVAFAIAGYSFAGLPIPPVPRLGPRGIERARAMYRPWFAVLDPVIRYGAALLSRAPLARWRARQEIELRRAGYWLGLAADEYIALTALSTLGFATAFGFVAHVFVLNGDLPLWGSMVGFALPGLRIREVIRLRVKAIPRALPQAIESVALCMGAGLDFPGSLKMLLSAEVQRDPLAHEFEAILEELDLGHTRREALLNFGERVKSADVRDFVRAVVQAEQKGSPLAHTLRVQGRMLSLRRSVAAEEAAARAGVLMIGPMLLLFACILLLLMGPFLVKGVGI